MDDTRTTIARMARLLRYTLKASNRDRVTLREELAFVRGYLALEHDRFEERLTVELDADEAALDMQIPPMLLQPLVENAVKHGIAPTVEGGTVRIAVRRTETRVAVTVADTGAGTDRSIEDLFLSGLGLRATNRRLNILHDAALQIKTAPGDGFTVWFEMPAEPHDAPAGQGGQRSPGSAPASKRRSPAMTATDAVGGAFPGGARPADGPLSPRPAAESSPPIRVKACRLSPIALVCIPTVSSIGL